MLHCGSMLGRNPERITLAGIVRAFDDSDPVPTRVTTGSGMDAAADRTSLDELRARIHTTTIEHLENIMLHKPVVEQLLKCGYTEQQRLKRVAYLRPSK